MPSTYSAIILSHSAIITVNLSLWGSDFGLSSVMVMAVKPFLSTILLKIPIHVAKYTNKLNVQCSCMHN